MHSHLNRDMILRLEKKTLKLQQTEETLRKEIEKRKSLENSLKLSEERLCNLEQSIAARLGQVQKLEAIGTLASGIAHDFNNILAVVLGNCELTRTILPDDAQVQPFLKAITTAGERAKDLVQQILGFSRDQENSKKPILLHVVVNEVLKLMRAALPATIDFNINICRDVLYVMADVVQIHQIVVKLCTDAAKAMEEKQDGVLSVTLAPVEVDPAAMSLFADMPSGSYLQLEIADTGKGIDPEPLNRLFKNQITSQGATEKISLDFADIKEIIKAHHGDIRVESEPGAGASFKIILPVIGAETEKDRAADDYLPTGSEHIQFIDDESALADAGKQFFSQLGYQVNCFADSRKAWDDFKSHPFSYDMVITDMTMPHINGQTLARQMVRLRPDIPIILCSGHSKDSLAETARQVGIQTIVPKPLVFADLARSARRLLDASMGLTSR